MSDAITLEKFDAFIEVRDSGVTNMFDSTRVAMEAYDQCGVSLSRKDVIEIISNFDELAKRFENGDEE